MAKKEKIDWRDNFKALRYIPRFFSLIWQTNKFYFSANIIMRLVKSMLPVMLLWVGKLIIDEVVLQSAAVEKEFSYIWLLLGVELGLALISNLLSRAIGLTDGLLGDLYANKSSVELIQKAASMQLSQLEDATFYDKLERARRQTNNRVTLMSTVLSQGQDIITVISLITGLIVFQPFLILLLLVAIIPSFLNEIKFSRFSYSLVRSWTPERRELDYLRYIGASDVTAKEVKLFSLADFLSERFSKLADKYYLANRALAVKRAVWGSLFNVIGDLSYYAAYVIIVIRTVAGVITIGDLTFLAGSFRNLRNQLQSIFQRFTRITESALYLKDYFDFMDIKNEELGDSKSVPIGPIREGFTFDNVSFKYPESENYVLRKVSFTLNAGEKMALVGENGAGKTTLVKLILRMYEPTEGRILLDGKDIWSFDPNEYQKCFGVIFQDFVRYHFTARENIAIGKIDELSNQDRIEYAARKSLADQVVESLPDKYNQQLGKRFHEGKDLSGGQWQKVALARAYMKNAQVIVLDEPTAALDARAEFEAFERFTELSEGKTAVLISHRFSTVRMADRILVLKNGGVLEIGTHEELLSQGGLYAELFNYQAQGYR
jgi:ATP-binding cassette subfamily B protein